MDDLIIRVLQGRATPEEVAELHHQQEFRPEIEARYRALEKLWALTSPAAATIHDRVVPGADALIARAEAEMVEASRTARRGLWMHRIKVGAVAACLGAIGFGIGRVSLDVARPALLAESEIITGAGEMTTITLADGSSVRLGPQSHLRLKEEGDDRVAYLEGRAFFGVQADPARRFVVRTRFGEAVVHGTRFEVRSEDEEFRVLVVDGNVRVAGAGGEADLRASDMVHSAAGGVFTASHIEDDEVYAYLDWMGNSLVFQATPVEKALREIERRYGVKTILEDLSLAQMSVTATFTDQKVEEIIHVLCEIIGARCSISNGQVRVGIEGAAPRGGI